MSISEGTKSTHRHSHIHSRHQSEITGSKIKNVSQSAESDTGMNDAGVKLSVIQNNYENYRHSGKGRQHA